MVFILGRSRSWFLDSQCLERHNPFRKKLRLKAQFMDANGLREGSEVRLAGVRVGKIDEISCCTL